MINLDNLTNKDARELVITIVEKYPYIFTEKTKELIKRDYDFNEFLDNTPEDDLIVGISYE